MNSPLPMGSKQDLNRSKHAKSSCIRPSKPPRCSLISLEWWWWRSFMHGSGKQNLLFQGAWLRTSALSAPWQGRCMLASGDDPERNELSKVGTTSEPLPAGSSQFQRPSHPSDAYLHPFELRQGSRLPGIRLPASFGTAAAAQQRAGGQRHISWLDPNGSVAVSLATFQTVGPANH